MVVSCSWRSACSKSSVPSIRAEPRRVVRQAKAAQAEAKAEAKAVEAEAKAAQAEAKAAEAEAKAAQAEAVLASLSQQASGADTAAARLVALEAAEASRAAHVERLQEEAAAARKEYEVFMLYCTLASWRAPASW